MAEQDPREYRGGVHEPEEGKGVADNEGIVPREMVDEPTADTSADDQELGDAVMGAVTDKDPSDSAIDTAGGDQADATEGLTGATVDDADALTAGDPVSKWDAANAALGDTGNT